MKKLAYTLILLCCFYGSCLAQVPRSATYFIFKKLAVNPTTATDTTRADLYFKYSGTAGDTGLYRRFQDGSIKRIDSVATGNTRQDTLVQRFPVISRTNVTTTDSIAAVKIPIAFKVDSIMSIGQDTVVYNVYRNRGGTVVAMLSSNATTPVSYATASGLQNNTLIIGDEIWTVIKSGTATWHNIQIVGHGQ